MKRYTLKNYYGLRVHVVEAKSDSQEQVRIAVLGDSAFNKKPFAEYRDVELEAQGWKKLALVNGSLFFSEGTSTYANGIEKACGVIHENDDVSWDNNMGFYHNDGVPYMYTQRYLKSIISRPDVRGAMTGAFGLLNNGVTDISGAKIGQPSRTIYLQKSGRTIVGKKADGTIVLAVFDGVTGQSGLTGYETVLLAKKLGLRNAVCMDGGGSTYLEYKGVTFNSSAREGANAVAIYLKATAPEPFKVGDLVSIVGTYNIESIVGETAFLKELGTYVNFNKLKKVS